MSHQFLIHELTFLENTPLPWSQINDKLTRETGYNCATQNNLQFETNQPHNLAEMDWYVEKYHLPSQLATLTLPRSPPPFPTIYWSTEIGRSVFKPEIIAMIVLNKRPGQAGIVRFVTIQYALGFGSVTIISVVGVDVILEEAEKHVFWWNQWRCTGGNCYPLTRTTTLSVPVARSDGCRCLVSDFYLTLLSWKCLPIAFVGTYGPSCGN